MHACTHTHMHTHTHAITEKNEWVVEKDCILWDRLGVMMEILIQGLAFWRRGDVEHLRYFDTRIGPTWWEGQWFKGKYQVFGLSNSGGNGTLWRGIKPLKTVWSGKCQICLVQSWEISNKYIKYRDVYSVKAVQSCQTLYDLMDSALHGILQARLLEWVVMV